MKDGWRRRALKRAVWSVVLLAVAYAALLSWLWSGRIEITIKSAALDEDRQITVFGGTSRKTIETLVFSLDGQNHRHALLPAAHGLLLAKLYGQPAPVLVAVHSGGKRDIDFRPANVRPASWRSKISGRGVAFDAFLLDELRPEIEKRFGRASKHYLFGHSLSGFYTLDMATRRPQHGFSKVFAFSPTFSHDLSLIDRLEKVCANSEHIYANIGLESGRDTAVFSKAEARFNAISKCSGRVHLERHYAIVHQLIMLTGQAQALRAIYAAN